MLEPQLTPREDAFIHAYFTHGRDKIRAAIEAGYSAASAQQAASRLMSRPAVKAAIEARTVRKREQAAPVSQPPPTPPPTPTPPDPHSRGHAAQEGGRSIAQVSEDEIASALWTIGRSVSEATKDRLTALKLLAQMKGLLNQKGAPNDDPDDGPDGREPVAQLTFDELRGLDAAELERMYRAEVEATGGL